MVVALFGLPAAAAAAPPPAVSAVGDLHILTATDSGGLFHALRFGNGSWTGAGDVKAVLGDPGFVIDTASAVINDDLHVLLVTGNGDLFHAVRFATGVWSQLGDVEAQIGDPGVITDVAAANVTGSLHVVVRTFGAGQAGVFHTVRSSVGAWTGFGDVGSQAGAAASSAIDVAAAGIGDQLHVLVVTGDDGGVHHAIRVGNGLWTAFGNVTAVTGSPGFVVRSAAATVVLQELHILVSTGDGGLFHAIRFSNGGWTAIGNVKAATGDPGPVFDVGATGVSGGLQIVVSTNSGGLFHAVRFGNGLWTGFGDVKAVIGDPGAATWLSVAG